MKSKIFSVSQTKPEDEVFNLYETVTRQISVPLCIYDNPATTGFSFSDEQLFAVASLPNVGSIKLGRVPEDLSQVRARLPDTVTLGIAGEWRAASALQAGFDVWYSVLGVVPKSGAGDSAFGEKCGVRTVRAAMKSVTSLR